jgi:hydrogenase/urease accessory protein HupE
MLGFMKFQLPPRLAKTTAAVLIVGMLVCGAVLIWAPQETVTALIGLAGLALGALLRGLLHGDELTPAAHALKREQELDAVLDTLGTEQDR